MKSSSAISHRGARQIRKRLVKVKAPIRAASPFQYNVCCMGRLLLYCFVDCTRFEGTWISPAMANLFRHDPTHCYGTDNSHCPAIMRSTSVINHRKENDIRWPLRVRMRECFGVVGTSSFSIL